MSRENRQVGEAVAWLVWLDDESYALTVNRRDTAPAIAEGKPFHPLIPASDLEQVSRERDGLKKHLAGMLDAYQLLCADTGKRYDESPSSKYAAARAFLHNMDNRDGRAR